MTKCCIQRIAVLWLKYISFAVLFMTDLMYLSSTTSLCHIGETDVKTTANKMYFSHSTAIYCIQHLVVKIASELHLGMEHCEKL